jgi:hypothetical protein
MMLDDLREKLRAIRQSYTDDLNQLMDDVKQEKISGEEISDAGCRSTGQIFRR